MNRRRSVRPLVALTAACLFCACSSTDIDEIDHDSLFLDARVRKQLSTSDNGSIPYLEAGWTSVQGETDHLDYKIGTANLGAGIDIPLAENVTMGFGGGCAWQLDDFDTDVGNLDESNAFGLYIALEAAWRATPWLEPYVRMSGMHALDELLSTEQYEAGARLHFVEHVALVLAWRYASYDIDDIDSGLNISSIELDSVGFVAGLLISF